MDPFATKVRYFVLISGVLSFVKFDFETRILKSFNSTN